MLGPRAGRDRAPGLRRAGGGGGAARPSSPRLRCQGRITAPEAGAGLEVVLIAPACDCARRRQGREERAGGVSAQPANLGSRQGPPAATAGASWQSHPGDGILGSPLSSLQVAPTLAAGGLHAKPRARLESEARQSCPRPAARGEKGAGNPQRGAEPSHAPSCVRASPQSRAPFTHRFWEAPEPFPHPTASAP